MISKILERLEIPLEEVEELSSKNSYNLKKLKFEVKRIKTLAKNPYRLEKAKFVKEDVRFFSRMFNSSSSPPKRKLIQNNSEEISNGKSNLLKEKKSRDENGLNNHNKFIEENEEFLISSKETERGKLIFSSDFKEEEEEIALKSPEINFEEINLKPSAISVRENHTPIKIAEVKKLDFDQKIFLEDSLKKANSSRHNLNLLDLVISERESYLSKKGLFEGKSGLNEAEIMRSSSRNLRTIDSHRVRKLIKENIVERNMNNLKHKVRKSPNKVEYRSGEY